MDTLPAFFKGELSDYSTDKLPDFVPIGASPMLTAADVQKLCQSSDPHIAAAEAQCRAGNSTYASASIDQLVQDGTPAESLQLCLLEATCSGDTALVRKLLSLGVPVNMNLMEPAIKRRSLDLLLLFLEYGLDINKEVEWCFPPPLSLALDTGADELVIAWFLDHGADPDARCQMDMTPLSIAMQFAPLSIIKMLFVHTSAPQNGQLLHYAARRTSRDSDEVIDLVLQHCKNLEVNDIMYHNHAFSFEIRKCVGLGTALHEAD
ncbi:hypothetical protein LTR91_015327 [Friedmanniomyces endolithicus]|uniref:Uncharacterized protein n=1 Tax=Friedmanniomyces endolithicus TaxID=329885 RepID=A0AAN6QM86_9PEZI|nr:hypothetical protein LTR94_006377 [Friedmanniomyces endolithicus]KAK0801173.1 hypothetical protein LTR59_005465 [Friedmanniomyces endolithicus]KAK0808223.1 hypothetical protein LTR38_004689 [Friedmanniomyces endolithicus]KAK0809088.1 hypothetical protein LTR75_006030 [Friedmanniomyces endolithicus]KAK0822679.1 hypothetical protein LTR03_018088 [Friedmanniomyces endolithicus]